MNLFFCLILLLFIHHACPGQTKQSRCPASVMETKMKNVRDFGAVGNGVTDDTAALQNAIRGGGIVQIPAGRYLTGTLYLCSGLDLRFEPGAVLLASTDPARYNTADFDPRNPPPSKSERASARHLICAMDCRDLKISGGTIDGRAPLWMNEADPDLPKILKLNPERPAQMLFFCECENVSVSNLKLKDSTYWNFFLHGCRNVKISGLEVSGRPNQFNNDGLDIDCCQNVTVRGCVIDTGDDALAIRGASARLGGNRPCEKITVRDCVLRSAMANAIRVGVGSDRIRDCLFENISVKNSLIGIGLLSKYSNSGEGCRIEKIVFRNIHLEAARAFSIRTRLNERISPPEYTEPAIREIEMENITGSASLTSILRGTAENRIENVRIRNLFLEYKGSGAAPDLNPDGLWGRWSGSELIVAEHASNVLFENAGLNCFLPENVWHNDLTLNNCSGFVLKSCRRNGNSLWKQNAMKGIK